MSTDIKSKNKEARRSSAYMKKEINYKKLTGRGSWFGVFLVLFLGFCAGLILIVAASAFMEYMINEKLETQYASVAELVRRYEKADAGSAEDALKNFDEADIDYYILNTADNGIVYSRGEVVRFDESDEMYNFDEAPDDESGWNVGVSFYQGTEIGFIRPEGLVGIDLVEMLRLLKEKGSVEKNAVIYSTPVWMETDVKNGSEKLFTKLELKIKRNDISYVVAFFFSVAMLFLLFQILLVISLASDAAKRRKTLKLLFTDMITGGQNRRWFVFKGNQIIRKKQNQNRKYAVVSLRMVNYSNFCICHSLAEGEAMLCRITNILKGSLQKKELSAISGSASFALLLKYTDEKMIEQRVRGIISRLETINPEHKFAFHAGIAVVDETDMTELVGKRRTLVDIEKVYNYASLARDTLKGSDDSGVVLLDSKLIEDRKWVDIVHEKQQAALDNEEFVVYYQPKYNPQTDELSGAEALIRWQSPEYGFVAPYKIIPIFEQNGFITQIDHYMLKHVARDQKRWLDEGRNIVPVSVNVSRAHFIEPGLAEQIRDMVDAEGCPRQYIEIELTESAFFDDKKALIETINKLKGYGFAVSMDDFGAGYSSLNSLKDMPLDVLKLDADFFRGDKDDPRAQIVVEEAIHLAKRLDMRTVAEGVEERDQVDFLATKGCDMIQGYYYAKPMPAEEYEQRMYAKQAE